MTFTFKAEMVNFLNTVLVIVSIDENKWFASHPHFFSFELILVIPHNYTARSVDI